MIPYLGIERGYKSFVLGGNSACDYNFETGSGFFGPRENDDRGALYCKISG
jgi:hypothetical protein